MRVATAVAVATLLAACSRVPTLQPGEVPIVVSMADQLLNSHPVGEVPSSDWPYAISELLHPEAVRIASEGLYIVTSRRFVDEAGIFVAREASWTDTDPAEPFFTPIADRVFEFQAPG